MNLIIYGSGTGCFNKIMMRIPKILIVDGNPEIRLTVQQMLTNEGCTVYEADTAHAFRQLLANQDFDVVILGGKILENENPTAVDEVSRNKSIGILLITDKDDVSAQRQCNLLGAHGYVRRPLDQSEMCRRIQNILARTAPGTEENPDSFDKDPLLGGEEKGQAGDNENRDFLYDPLGRTVILPDQRQVNLTQMENRLLCLILEAPGQSAMRGDLLDKLYGGDKQKGSRAVDVLVARLRQKIDSGGRPWQIIQTTHGRGYKITAKINIVPMPEQFD